MAVCQNLVPLVNIKIAGKWVFIPLKMVLIGIDPYPHTVRVPDTLVNLAPSRPTISTHVGYLGELQDLLRRKRCLQHLLQLDLGWGQSANWYV